MAAGELKWSSKGKDVQKFDRTPVTAGDYDLKINAKDISQKKGTEPGKVPYISLPLEVLGTATSETGKNRKVFCNIFLHMTPSPKDGKNMLERQGGLLDLAKSLGQDLELGGIKVRYQKYDVKNQPDGEMTQIVIAKPSEVLEFLKSLDGTVVRGHVKVEKGSGGYDPSNKVDYFIPSEDAGSTEEEFSDLDEEDEEKDEEDAESEEEDVEEDLDEEVEEEDSSPDEEDMTSTFNPKKGKAPIVKAPPSKVKQGPAGKGKSKK